MESVAQAVHVTVRIYGIQNHASSEAWAQGIDGLGYGIGVYGDVGVLRQPG